MSDLAMAVIDWTTKLHELTGEEPERIVLPARAHEMLAAELMKEPMVPAGDPVSGVGLDGRIWLAATELVPDERFDEHVLADYDVKLVGSESEVLRYRRDVMNLREAAANVVAQQHGDISRKPFIGRLRDALAVFK